MIIILKNYNSIIYICVNSVIIIYILLCENVYNDGLSAQVAKLVDARDLKSLGRNTVPVRLRPWAPIVLFFKLISFDINSL